MVDGFNDLAKRVFKKDLSQLDKDELQNFAHQYPYFAPAHFLRLAKEEKGLETYDQQFQKAILYYHDPLTFEQFITPQNEPHFREPEIEYEELQIADDIIEPEIELTEEKFNATEVVEQAETLSEPLLPLIELKLSEEPLTGTELTFEPYHTVDYFASQGIKITADGQAQDKFGKQVKSFTDWLKTMKKLPLSEFGKTINASAEKGVENLAEHSVQDADVVTESMAEVWVKQGNIQKAAEVYQKLSLQNPSKSAYFAAKIQQLTSSI